MTKLAAKSRSLAGKQVKTLRTEGLVPAAMYGPKFEAKNVVVDLKEFKKVYKEAGYSNLIDVQLEGEGTEKALIKEVQEHPVSDEVLHVSLYVVDAKSEINAEIPVHFEGESPIEKTGEGFVVFALHTVDVRCLPKDLPASLTVDVSSLAEIGQSILVQEIKLPEGVAFDSKQDQHAAVAYVAAAQKIEDVLAEVEANAAAAAESAEGEEGATPAEGEDAEGGEGETESTEE